MRHMVVRRLERPQVATIAGLRFHRDAPLKQWIINDPAVSIRRRTAGRLNRRFFAFTSDILADMQLRGMAGLDSHRWTQDGADANVHI